MWSQEQHIESRHRQRFIGEEARRRVRCRAYLFYVGTEVRLYPESRATMPPLPPHRAWWGQDQ
jgi:hypothetical protein